MYLPIYLPTYLSVCLPVYLSTCLSASLKTKLFCKTSSFSKLTTSKTKQVCETSSMFELDNVKNEAILREFFIFSKLTTPKTKQFCETSSCFELDNIQNKAVLWDLFNFWTCHHQKQSNSARLPSKMESWVQRWRPRTNALNATHLRKSAPWPPNISDEHVFCTAPATRHASLQILFNCPTPAIVFGNATKPLRFTHFWEGAQSLAPATRNDIWTSKSGANM